MTNTTTRPILANVRDLMPSHTICLGQAYLITEQQAMRLLKLLKIKRIPVDVGRFGLLPGVNVTFRARTDRHSKQSMPTRREGGWAIELCEDDPLPERRHNLAREIKRILDQTTASVVYEGFHCPDERHFRHKIESLQDNIRRLTGINFGKLQNIQGWCPLVGIRLLKPKLISTLKKKKK